MPGLFVVNCEWLDHDVVVLLDLVAQIRSDTILLPKRLQTGHELFLRILQRTGFRRLNRYSNYVKRSQMMLCLICISDPIIHYDACEACVLKYVWGSHSTAGAIHDFGCWMVSSAFIQ